MPLIDLTTDLTSLKFGSPTTGDRPGGGWSGQPYIQSPIEGNNTAGTNPEYAQFVDFYSLNRDTLDFPIRGGSVYIDSATGRLATPAGDIDRKRIKAFLNDKQRGTIFIKKQIGLQLSNPKIQTPGVLAPIDFQISSDFDSPIADLPVNGNSALGRLLEATRVYNPSGITTLQQVVTQGTGTHITRHGLIPTYTGLFGSGYQEYVRANNGEHTNRLAILASAKLLSDNPIYSPNNPKALDYGISFLNDEILNYAGGPGSVYGIGFTTIKRATNTNTGTAYTPVAYTYDTIASQKIPTGVDVAHPALQDFRENINKQAGNRRFLMTGNYPTDNIEKRLKVGNPGARYNRINYTDTHAVAQDGLNMQGLFSYDTSIEPWNIIQEDGSTAPKDMIKFVFECLSNDTPGDAIAIFFRSFLTNFSDSNQAELSPFRYLGRGETFRTYQGFDRSIAFSFKIAAFTRDEMQPLYKKLNHLISQVYPDYSPTSRFMRAPLMKLTIGDYLYRVPGFLDSVNITVDDNVSWEIALDKLNDFEMRELPQVISVQCSFKPIHNILPRRETNKNPFVPLIADTRAYLDTNIPTYTKAGQEATVNARQQTFDELGSAAALFNTNTTNQPPKASDYDAPREDYKYTYDSVDSLTQGTAIQLNK